MQEAIMMRVDNNLGGYNILEELARARETKNMNPTPKGKNLQSNQKSGTDQVSKAEFSGPAALESKPQSAEIINFEEAQKILNDTGNRMLRYPNDLIFAQANNKPEAVLKLIS
jgi:hypothetical protein